MRDLKLSYLRAFIEHFHLKSLRGTWVRIPRHRDSQTLSHLRAAERTVEDLYSNTEAKH